MPAFPTIDDQSEAGSYADALLFPHPNLKVSEHAPGDHTKSFEPRRGCIPAAALADGAVPAAPPSVVRELSDHAVHDGRNNIHIGDNHAE